MKIEVGQIWRRLNPMHGNEMYYPPKGWKVEITAIRRGTITHKIVEYNGEPMPDARGTSHFLDDFLSMYELDEE